MLVLRDQDSIETLAKRLPGIRRSVLVGNGGIALEVAFAFSGLEVLSVRSDSQLALVMIGNAMTHQTVCLHFWVTHVQLMRASHVQRMWAIHVQLT